MLIQRLEPSQAPLVADFYRAAPDYWLLAEGGVDPALQAQAFFADAPPGCDLTRSHHLGLFLGPRLSGVAEVSYGFPEPADAYLGLMLLGPWAQGMGHGRAFLAEVERLARTRGAVRLFVAVLQTNPRGRAFWEREGFGDTGLSGPGTLPGQVLHRMVKPL